MNIIRLIFIQLALLMIFHVGYSQSEPFYSDLFLEPSGELMDKNGGYLMYDLGHVVLYNGIEKNARTFYVKDVTSGNEIFEYQNESIKNTRFDPKFFKASNDLPIVIMMDIETSFSWGQHVFLINGNMVTYAGFLPYGADDFNFSNLGLYAQFRYKGDYLELTFREGVKYINYLTDDLLSSADLKFKVSEKEKKL